MRYLADTHLLLWSMLRSAKLRNGAIALLANPDYEIYLSTICIWETAIKFALGREDFFVPPDELRIGLLATGFRELTITSSHAIAVAGLPRYHRDPFDRLLVAQATVEQMTLLTSDKILARYPNTLLV